MDTKRFQYCKSFHQSIMAPTDRNWQTLTKNCYSTDKALGYYFNSLRLAVILPYDLEFTKHRFSDLITKVSRLPNISISQYTCSRYDCECRDESASDLSSYLHEEVMFLQLAKKNFICLDCLKTETRSKFEGNCRISHS